MNVTDFMAASRRTFKKAKTWERRFKEYAEAARAVGCDREADNLEEIGARAGLAAEAYLESLKVEGV